MGEPIYITSEERLEFEPECVKCGRQTKRTFSIDTATPAAVRWASLLIPYTTILSYFLFAREGTVRIPFCFRCHWEHSAPAKGTMVEAVIAIVLLALFLYLMAIGWYIAATAAFVATFVSLISVFRQERRRNPVLPFRVWRSSGLFHYEFTFGYHYDRMRRALDEDEADVASI